MIIVNCHYCTFYVYEDNTEVKWVFKIKKEILILELSNLRKNNRQLLESLAFPYKENHLYLRKKVILMENNRKCKKST
jgi:hypothetical protein